jgi:hypothetical protein
MDAQSGATDPSLLCLKCRMIGHVVDDCASSSWSPEFDWFFSSARMAMDFGNAASTAPHQQFCRRCQDLDVLQLLHEDIPWVSLNDLGQAARDGSELIRNIGLTGSIEFRKDCPLCCCLFAMTPNPSSPTQEILLLPHWTMNRLTGEKGADMDREEKRQYAKCLLVALKPSSVDLTFSTRVHRGDALCILEGDDADLATTLGGRQVSSRSLNTTVIQEWLDTCSRLHGAHCSPVYTEDLHDIRLIDVLDREVVRYPGHSCDYVALSYVWGGITQQSFQLGSSLSPGSLPQTIEDAMACVRILGKRYLWVDLVCIDQFNEQDKRNQIGKMWSIYRGAYVTLVALSGESANAGLPRLGSNMHFHSQLTCHVGGKRLVGLMPTLSQQIWVSPWGKRAWTLQEAMLSPRCLYFSDHQLYFECNAMQCCESLNQARSWAHSLCRDSNPTQEGWISWMMAQNGPGCLKNPLDAPSQRLDHYGAKVILYSFRTMTNDADALNAFLGVLQRLETMYEDGFFWGLPIADFQWALLWYSQSPPTRRERFPTWSWAGWKAGVWPGEPIDITQPHRYPVPLHIWRMIKDKLMEVFKSPQEPVEGPGADLETPFRNDPINTVARSGLKAPEFDISQYPRAEDDGYLFVEAIVFQFIPEWSHPVYRKRRHGEFELFLFDVRGTRCALSIISTDREIRAESAVQTQQRFILLARDRSKGLVFHHLLLVHDKEGVAVRGTALQLLVPEDHLEILEDLHPQKQYIVLA